MSVREFFSAPTRFLTQSISKESEFEKPYLDDDRGRMHNDFPWPDWPPFPDLPPLPPFEGPTPGLTLCGIVCYEPLSDCDEPIRCHGGIWCGYDPACELCSWMVEGATTGYTWKRIVGGKPDKFWGIDIWIDKNLLVEGKALIHVQMKDPCGNLCGEDLEVTCKVCPADIAMTWDDANSAETIGQGNGGDAEAAVYVQDGLGPYTWSVSGTGFSMASPETDVAYNTLLADATACGTATITVTDFCEDSVIGYVRGTEGSDWVQKSTGTCVAPGAAVWYGSGTGTKYFEAVYGYQRQREVIVYHAFRVNRTCGVDDGCTDYCIDGYHCLNSPFIDDLTRNITPNCQQEGADIRCWCGNINLTYWEWECV